MKIYKITNETDNEIYIGSTCQSLNQRFTRHKTDLKMYNDGRRNYRTSFIILNKQNPKIELLEDLGNVDIEVKLQKEKEYMIRYRDICVNKTLPINDNMIFVVCPLCDKKIKKNGFSTHKKTKKHIELLNNNNNI